MKKVLEIRGYQVEFYPQLYLVIPNFKCLVLSDIHLGKSNHFRRNGVALTQGIHTTDLSNWNNALNSHDVEMCIVTGDLFHSAVGDEEKDLYELVSSHSSVQFILTSGNHDPHLSDYPPNFNVSEQYKLGPFSFSHEPISNTEYYQFTGHLHPILKMNGKARNRVSLKAFWVRTNQCILPAFGYTTYGKTIQPGPEDLLLGAAPDQIIALNHSDFTRIQR